MTEPAATRDHTERMLRAAGARVESLEPRTTPVAGGRRDPRITIAPGRASRAGPDRRPRRLLLGGLPRWSPRRSCLGSAVRLEGVGLNPTRVGLLGILNRMGAAIEVEEDADDGGEPRGTIVARHSPLTATRVHPDEVPRGDRRAAPGRPRSAASRTARRSSPGAGELRHKESDRIASVVDGLARDLGAEIEATEDGFVVAGAGGLRGGTLDSRGDHRLAMLGAVAGLASREGVEVAGMDAAAVSYPRFEADLASLLARRVSASLGVAPAGPGGEEEQQARVLGRADLVAFVGVEVGEQAGAAADRARRRRPRSLPTRPAARRARGPDAPASRSPAGSSITIARPSASESRTSGLARLDVEFRDLPGPHRCSGTGGANSILRGHGDRHRRPGGRRQVDRRPGARRARSG